MLVPVMALIVKRNPGLLKLTHLTPPLVLGLAALRFAVTLVATFVMARIEKRPVSSFGLPLRPGLEREFGWGAVWGFAALSALLGVLWLNGNFHIQSLADSGPRLLLYAAYWALAFLAVGFAEEFMFRGYLQITLARPLGFWRAAVVLSLLFAGVHYTNSGESLFGLLEVFLIAIVFCFTLWRTGALWFAVGYHAAWDWAETCFYGTADSGVQATHNVFHSSFSGPHWLTGGAVGPEGSALNIPLNLIVIVLFYFFWSARQQHCANDRP